MSSVGLAIKAIRQAMSVCDITSAASVAYNQHETEQGSTRPRKRDATNALWIESLLGCVQVANELFLLIILPNW